MMGSTRSLRLSSMFFPRSSLTESELEEVISNAHIMVPQKFADCTRPMSYPIRAGLPLVRQTITLPDWSFSLRQYNTLSRNHEQKRPCPIQWTLFGNSDCHCILPTQITSLSVDLSPTTVVGNCPYACSSTRRHGTCMSRWPKIYLTGLS
ncbi:hypothetical protein EDD22DRAFT_330367 [Suillus occidentalis]|nr:hypothetical protein EDD22DRAFT_330367 [Suillus occidentalis]